MTMSSLKGQQQLAAAPHTYLSQTLKRRSHAASAAGQTKLNRTMASRLEIPIGELNLVPLFKVGYKQCRYCWPVDCRCF